MALEIVTIAQAYFVLKREDVRFNMTSAYTGLTRYLPLVRSAVRAV